MSNEGEADDQANDEQVDSQAHPMDMEHEEKSLEILDERLEPSASNPSSSRRKGKSPMLEEVSRKVQQCP